MRATTCGAAGFVVVYNLMGLSKLPFLRAAGMGALHEAAGLPQDDFLVTLLVLTCLCLCASALADGWGAALGLFAAVWVVVPPAEALSLRCGVPFGEYAFTEDEHQPLGPPVLGMPLLVPLAWYCSLAPSVAVARALAPGAGGAAQSLLGAVLVAGGNMASDPLMSNAPGHLAWNYDSLEEAVARSGRAVGDWTWRVGGGGVGGAAFEGVPLTNFVGWFAVGLACQALWLRARGGPSHPRGALGPLLLAWTHASTGIFYLLHPVHPAGVRAAGALLMTAPALAATRGVFRGQGRRNKGTKAS